jgi:Domain of unknown function (DUF3883)
MASNYAAIRLDNERRYGTDIGRIGPMLLTDRYADRTHFIFELLQNAEDALARRTQWSGSRAVEFVLKEDELRVTHWGKPFDDPDVRGVCGIAESTKDLTAIGRFGIGFKSVYAFTDQPEIHSGDEDFAIENFVWPTTAPPIDRDADQTVIVLPFKENDGEAQEEIIAGLQRLGPTTLLFLRQIEEIAWKVEDGPSGVYLRGKPKHLSASIRRIHVVGEEEGKPGTEETWLICSREVRTSSGSAAVGVVEIAFSVTEDGPDEWSIQPVGESPLVVFFPTVLATHLGFLVQGPYRTTPSRDNVPRANLWNRRLVRETASLLVQTLRWFRDNSLLATDVLRCLPLDRGKFSESSMFAPIFTAVRTALLSEPLLPAHGGEYAAANGMRLARTQELRELLNRTQLGGLFGIDAGLSWLSGDITHDREPELRRYIIAELQVPELTPDALLLKLNKPFLGSQSDDWITTLYEFLNGQPALVRQCRRLNIPLVRLTDGSHIAAFEDDQPQAFLPSSITTSFPTVRPSVCRTEEARRLLISLGLTEPDPVDDVVRNILPKYRADDVAIDQEYGTDIERIVKAFNTDSKGQREKLVAALRETTFVMAVDAGSASTWVAKPSELYLATERLNELFAGVPGILLVDDSYSCLRGEDVRELLEACGAQRYLQPVAVEPSFSWEERRSMRKAAGCENSSRGDTIHDYTLRGLDQWLLVLWKLDAGAASRKAALLWDALGDVEDRRGRRSFFGSYSWFYFSSQSCPFDAAFVRTLNALAWIPGSDGKLQSPAFVTFESLGWESNPFLLSIIHFKPPIIETLAKEAGIEPGVLDLLKRLGVTSEAQLRERLGVRDAALGKKVADSVQGAIGKLLGGTSEPTPAIPDPTGLDPPGNVAGRSAQSQRGNGATASSHPEGRASQPGSSGRNAHTTGERNGSGTRSGGSQAVRPFVSYVAAHSEEDGPDPDGLEYRARMELEEKAIALILAREPRLRRTPTHNPGFDLFEGEDGHPARWVEVKAMTGDLRDRPVGMSRAQFEFARQGGEAYWLYVVEHAGSEGDARIVRINDPAGKAKTFTLDHGWLNIADVSSAGPTSREPNPEE